MMPMYPTSSNEYVGVIDHSGSGSGRDRLDSSDSEPWLALCKPGCVVNFSESWVWRVLADDLFFMDLFFIFLPLF